MTATRTAAPRITIEMKQRVDALMGERAGDGISPAEAASVINNDFGTRLTERHVWNLWLTGDING